jgi:hypothetical protein
MYTRRGEITFIQVKGLVSSAFQTNPSVNLFIRRHLRSNQIPAQICLFGVFCVPIKSRRKSVYSASSASQTNLSANPFNLRHLHSKQIPAQKSVQIPSIRVICVPNKPLRKSIQFASSAFQTNPGANPFNLRHLRSKQNQSQNSAQIPSIRVICVPNKSRHKNQRKSLKSASSAFPTNPSVNPFILSHLRSQQIPA